MLVSKYPVPFYLPESPPTGGVRHPRSLKYALAGLKACCRSCGTKQRRNTWNCACCERWATLCNIPSREQVVQLKGKSKDYLLDEPICERDRVVDHREKIN